jgi:hypothetical protein
MLQPSCSLSDTELTEQLGRYRAIGKGAQVLEWTVRTRGIRLSGSVPEALVERLIEVEQGCCPFFGLVWDRTARRLTISVSSADREPALEAISRALGVLGPQAG